MTNDELDGNIRVSSFIRHWVFRHFPYGPAVLGMTLVRHSP